MIYTLPASAGIPIVASDLVPVLLGDQWRAAIPFFQWLGIYAGFEAIIWGVALFSRLRWRACFCICQPCLCRRNGAADCGGGLSFRPYRNRDDPNWIDGEHRYGSIAGRRTHAICTVA